MPDPSKHRAPRRVWLWLQGHAKFEPTITGRLLGVTVWGVAVGLVLMAPLYAGLVVLERGLARPPAVNAVQVTWLLALLAGRFQVQYMEAQDGE